MLYKTREKTRRTIVTKTIRNAGTNLHAVRIVKK